jgi:tRNA nucleotidyltransferase (CCA-adding enzyme)
MDLILCHTTADFDTLGAAVGLARLQPGAKVVLTGGAHPAVRDFLALHRDEYPLLERRSVDSQEIRSLTVVDTQNRERLGKAAEWLNQPNLKIQVYDHHLEVDRDIPATQVQVEAVGATATLVVEQLQAQQISLTTAEATVMALGIHVDTGSLTFDHTTVRDAAALTWLMTQGASLRAIAEYADPGLSPQLQELLTVALDQLQTETVQGYLLAWVLLKTESYTPGLSHLASHLMSLTDSDCLLLGNCYRPGEERQERLALIGRSHIEGVDLNELLKPLGGGGHPRAASVTLKTSAQATLDQLLSQLKDQIPRPPTARELMSSPVRTIRPETTIDQAQRILLRYGHSGLSVVNTQDQLVGIISRRDLDIALHHGFSHAPVKGYMATPVKTITPETLLPEIESLMVTYDIGRLPVLQQDQLVGIVTRTDVLRQLHQFKQPIQKTKSSVIRTDLQERLRACLVPQLWDVLAAAADQAERRGWQLYLVGGTVRDLLLADPQASLMLQDIDLVVDGVYNPLIEGAGVELARSLQQIYPEAQLQPHGQFQTAKLAWPRGSSLDALDIDIATARTEFYPYPAANPEVEASSIRQDLYRRDFTINALAVRLTQPQRGELLDFFGGLLDLKQKQIRVLHPNSFIEDPTRIYRAVRFAVRLGFHLNPQTEQYIRYAIASGVYKRIQGESDKAPALQARLKNELKYILQASYWKPALKLLANLDALQCLHPSFKANDSLWQPIQLAERWLKRFDPQETTINHWEMLLEVLIAQLAPDYRGEVAQNLHLPINSIQRLQHLAQTKAEVIEALPQYQLPSQITHLLQQQDLPTLILIATQSPPVIRKQIWRYLSYWTHVKPLLNGDDLKQLGYKPGRQFRLILDDLLAATLDGVICNQAEAERFLAQRYPLSKSH